MRKKLLLILTIFIMVLSAYGENNETKKSQVENKKIIENNSIPESEKFKVLNSDDIIASYKIKDKTYEISYEEYKNYEQNSHKFPPQDKDNSVKQKYVDYLIKEITARTILYNQALEEKLDNESDIKQSIENQLRELIISKFSSNIINEVSEPTEKEIKDFYEANKLRYKVNEKYYIQYILSFCDDMKNETKKEKAKKQAEEALQKIKDGNDFSEIAETYSNSPTSYKGKKISFEPGQINSKIEEAAKSLEKDKVSSIIEIDKGYIIVKLIDHTPEEIEPFDKVKDKVKATLDSENKRTYWKKYLEDYAQKSGVKKNYNLLDQEKVNDTAVIFEFDNVKFTYSDLMKKISNSPQRKDAIRSPSTRDSLLNGILNEELVFYAAKQKGLDKDKEILGKIEEIKKDIIYNKKLGELIEKKMEVIEINDEEMKQFYEKNKEKLMTSKETKLKLIKIDAVEEDGKKIQNPSNKAMAKAFWKAREAYQKIKNGEDFDKIIKEYSGEDWDGVLNYQPMGPRGHIIDLAADKLKSGEITEPVKYPKGFYIIKMIDIKEPKQLSFEEAKDNVKMYIKGEKYQIENERLLDELTKNSNLQVNKDNVTKIVNSI